MSVLYKLRKIIIDNGIEVGDQRVHKSKTLRFEIRQNNNRDSWYSYELFDGNHRYVYKKRIHCG